MKIKLKLKNSFIPVNTPKIFKKDKTYVKKCLNTGWISSGGSFVKVFEKNFAKFIGMKYAVAVSSGTAALDIALKSLNLKKNDEVIIPAFSIISTALCVIKLGLKPILVDCDIHEWNTKSEDIIKKISRKTKAIIITHIYGFPVDMHEIVKICKKKNIKIIEDSAEVIGQMYKKRKCGTFGDLSTFSFYANKHITTGEGGMILTNDSKIYKKSSSLRNLCFGDEKNRFNHDDIGWNYRLTNIQAALGCGQLQNISWIIKRKREIGKMYHYLLKNNDKIYIQPLTNKYSKNIFWVFGVVIKKNSKIKRDQIVEELKRMNIETRNFFHPMNKQKIFKKMKIFSRKEKFQNAEYLSRNGFYLPSGLGIKNSQIHYVAKSLNKLLKNY